MKLKLIGAAVLAAAGLAGCNGPPPPAAQVTHHGRFAGIGIYNAGSVWAKMTVAAPAANAATAQTGDDDQVIVVVDSDTGEIRQCGNYSGYCVGLNPWSKALLASQQAPVAITRPAEQVGGRQDGGQ
ncbi:MAG TPA: hypothetical protein VHZ26_15865 [Caulobacteraceae bacterium]|jgi:hypothetical protein|nr:hypothetical protein [Caulobacteraceae bacterium]